MGRAEHIFIHNLMIIFFLIKLLNRVIKINISFYKLILTLIFIYVKNNIILFFLKLRTSF
jgi:hypothetical protein